MQNDSRKKDHFQFPVGQWYIYRMISSSVTMSCLNLLQFWVEEMHGEELNPSDMAWAPYISINYQTALRRTTKKTLLMFFPVRTRNSTYSFVRKPYQWVGADWFFWTGLLQLVWVMWYSAILHTETFNKRYPFIYMYFF